MNRDNVGYEIIQSKKGKLLKIQITKQNAKHFLLAYHELTNPRSLIGHEGLLSFIKKVGCIQFDPLNIVGKNSDLVLFSRIKNYKSEMLNDLLYKSQLLVDGWDKNMSIFQVEDWPKLQQYRIYYKNVMEKQPEFKKLIPVIKEKIVKIGSVSSLDFEIKSMSDWHWAPTRMIRAVLESLFWMGELFIHHRVGTRKYYDLIENHKYIDILRKEGFTEMNENYYQWHIERRIGSLGFLWNKASDAWIGIRKINRDIRDICFKKLIDAGKLHEISIKESNLLLFIRQDDIKYIDNIDMIGKQFREKPKASIIAPLDNILWDRKLIKALFNFDYVWEVYKPEKLRSYGYYVLPVLYGDKFIARFDAAIDRKKGEMMFKNWWWEKDTVIASDMKAAINECFKEFCTFCNVKNIAIENSKSVKSSKNEMYADLKSILKIV